MPSYWVELNLCGDKARSGPEATEEGARDRLLRIAVNRLSVHGEIWRSTSHLKWASTNGHTLEVIEE